MTLSPNQKRRLAVTATSNLQQQTVSRAMVLAPRRVQNTNAVVRVIPTTRVLRNRRRRQNRGLQQNRQANGVSPRLALQGSSALVNTPPKFNGSQTVVISRKEIFMTLTGSTAFTGVALALIPSLFPWLDGIALNFSQFRWRKLCVYYQTTSPTTYSGDVSLGAIYSDGSSPNSIAEVNSLAHGRTYPVWDKDGMLNPMVLDTAMTEKNKYSYISRDELGNLDVRDQVNYVPFWAVVGWQTSVNGQQIGRIFVDYEIEFFNPIPQRMNVPAANVETDTSAVRMLGAKAPKASDFVDPEAQVASALTLLTKLVLTQGGQIDEADAEEVGKDESSADGTSQK
jgi:hypothetical protein